MPIRIKIGLYVCVNEGRVSLYDLASLTLIPNLDALDPTALCFPSFFPLFFYIFFPKFLTKI